MEVTLIHNFTAQTFATQEAIRFGKVPLTDLPTKHKARKVFLSENRPIDNLTLASRSPFSLRQPLSRVKGVEDNTSS
uniref:Putative ovule protein n=1 Tax=Solanum chacoense TaxID=4108 RepID=A0A0V0H285_SOLCH